MSSKTGGRTNTAADTVAAATTAATSSPSRRGAAAAAAAAATSRNNAVASSSSSLTHHSVISSTSSSVNRMHRRQDRLRRKTIKTLNEHFYSNNTMETRRQEARLAGHLTADRIMWRVSRIGIGGGAGLSAAAAAVATAASASNNNSAEDGGGFDNDFASSASSAASFAATNSSASVVSLDSSERAIRRGRRRGAREGNEINSNDNDNNSKTFWGARRHKAVVKQHQSNTSSLLANRGSLNNSYISPFDLTTIAEHQQPYPQQQHHHEQQAAAAAAAMSVVSDGIISRQSNSNKSGASASTSSRSWFGGSSSKNNNKKAKKKKVVSAKQAAAMVAGWPTKGKYHLPQVLQVDQEPHERRDFYHHALDTINMAGGGVGVGGLLFFGGGNNNNHDSGHHGDGANGSTGGGNGNGGGDAWMCGVCGKAFATFEAAERHEQMHIEKVVEQLGFCAAPPQTAINKQNNRHRSSGRSTSFSSQRCSTQQQQPLAAPLTASNVAAAATAEGNQATCTGSTKFKSARQVFETETEQAPTHNSINNSARGISNGIANQRQGHKWGELHDGDGDDEHYDSEQDKQSADASTRNDIYRNHIRDSLGGGGVNRPDGLLVPRPRGDTAVAAAAAVAPPSTPLPSSMKQQGSQQHHHHQQQPQQPGRQTRSSEVRFEHSERSLPLQDAPLPNVDASQHRNVNNNNSTGDDFQDDVQPEQQAFVLSSAMQEYASLADEALVTVCEKARPLILTMNEWQAELELAYLASDKLYYDQMAERALARIVHPYSSRLRSEGEDILAKVQNKFVDAYQLCKEGENKKGFTDQYRKKQKDGSTNVMAIEHTDKTLYLNVMVKNSIQVVRHELERLARERWERDAEIEKYSRFERFRVYAHVNIVRLAGIALASDFTPRRIAVQLSNDLYRLLTPRLKRRGVTISTEIEYRVGPYFVLAVNINTIRWQKLIKSTYRDVAARKAKWVAERQPLSHEEAEEEAKKNRFVRTKDYLRQMFSLTRYEILAQFFAWFYELHWIVYQPICILWYYTFLGPTIRHFIISSVADEIFYYVEEKGMEMEIEIRQAATQAAFMLSALREIRADGQELKKKRQQSESMERGVVLGPLLGPAIKADKDPAVEPLGFELPANLEFIGLELDLPVGFRRLRWAILSNSSTFVTEALWRTEAKYDNITMEPWSKCDEYIGVPTLPDTVKEEDFVGAEKVASYLMPKSAFVSANMCTETSYILAYNDYCFCVKKRAATPGVPYGSTFFAWTQLLVVNTGNDTCRLSCSVEPEFPNGPPMVSRQITSGMRAGVGELFVKIGETITKYADEYP